MQTKIPLLEYDVNGEYACIGYVQARILNRRKTWEGEYREKTQTRIDIGAKPMTKELREGIEGLVHSHSAYLESIQPAGKKGEWIVTIIAYPSSHFAG